MAVRRVAAERLAAVELWAADLFKLAAKFLQQTAAYHQQEVIGVFPVLIPSSKSYCIIISFKLALI